MEKLFMSAGIVVAVVLCIVGIVKLPFDKFKEKHPNWYKAVFTLLSFVLGIGLAILDEKYLLKGKLLSVDFAILVCAVMAGIFGGYSGVYEGLGLKELMKKLTENVHKAKEIAEDKKVIKCLDKIDDIDKAIAYLEDRKFNKGNEV